MNNEKVQELEKECTKLAISISSMNAVDRTTAYNDYTSALFDQKAELREKVEILKTEYGVTFDLSGYLI